VADGLEEELTERMAALTPGFSGAQIANICNEAAILAARGNDPEVGLDHFERAIDRIIGGLEKRNSAMTLAEKRTVAFHEAGHAIAGWYLENADPLLKVSIVPRASGALGFAQYLPKEMGLHTEEQILDRIVMALGGRAAEELTFGTITTGAQDDLRRVSQYARAMVTQYGMSEKLGKVSFMPDDNQGMMPQKDYSEKTAELIDEEVKNIVDTAYQRAKDLLTEKSADLHKIAEHLLQNENITQNEVVDLIGKRPFSTPQTYREFMDASAEEIRKKEAAATPSEEEEEEVSENDDSIAPQPAV